MRHRWIAALLVFVSLTGPQLSGASRVASPLSPADALAAFDAEPGLKISLVATEPLIDSPCALAFDEAGRLYVAENRGYPLGGPGGEAVGRITLLEDTDGDGRMDQRSDFATGLTFPNGALPWRGGLIVTCAPDVLYLKDTDGDGKADLKEVLLTGFATNTTTQLRINAPLIGPDGWVYLASGLSGGSITSPKRPQQPALELKGDLRFRPDTGEFEGIDGKSQFGQSFDDFGRRFGCYNRVQVQHFVISSRHLARSVVPATTGVLQNCPDLVDNLLMRGGGGAARLYPISENITTADSHAGFFTAACAIHIYRGDGLPTEFVGHAFSCDPTGNLVHHDRLDPVGATFAARRVHEGTEFLRSPDGWFRPVFLATGPDGALYVADMYRQTIEHPEYLPAEVRKRTDFDAGKGRGRIWRVSAANPGAGPNRPPKLSSAPAEELIGELGAANGWRRDTAFRLLLERTNQLTAPQLREATPRLRDSATMASLLRLLDALGALDAATLSSGMDSSVAGVREVAVQLAEPRLKPEPALAGGVIRCATDRDARVRFCGALAMGTLLASPAREAPAPVAGIPGTVDSRAPALAALAAMAARDAADPWARTAVLCSSGGVERQLVRALLSRGIPDSDGLNSLLVELGRALAAKSPGDRGGMVLDLMRGELEAGRAIGLLSGFGDGLAQTAGEAGPGTPALTGAFASNPAASDLLKALLKPADEAAGNVHAPAAARARAISLLGHILDDSAVAALMRHVRDGEPVEVQSAALRALARRNTAGTAKALLSEERWRSYTPGLRSAVLESLLTRAAFHGAVLEAIEAGTLQPGAIPTTRRRQLLDSKDETIRARASKLFSTPGSAERQKAYEDAKAALSLTAKPENGHEVFKRVCASCHRLDREGFAVGPDLFDIRNQPKEAILLHLIIPEQEIAPNFTAYTCETRDGRTITGMLVADTPAGVTLRQAQAVEETIARNNVMSLAASKVSFMPQELEKAMTKQELADLLAWLKGER